MFIVDDASASLLQSRNCDVIQIMRTHLGQISNESVYVHILMQIDKCTTKRLKYNGNITVI